MVRVNFRNIKKYSNAFPTFDFLTSKFATVYSAIYCRDLDGITQYCFLLADVWFYVAGNASLLCNIMQF